MSSMQNGQNYEPIYSSPGSEDYGDQQGYNTMSQNSFGQQQESSGYPSGEYYPQQQAYGNSGSQSYGQYQGYSTSDVQNFGQQQGYSGDGAQGYDNNGWSQTVSPQTSSPRITYRFVESSNSQNGGQAVSSMQNSNDFSGYYSQNGARAVPVTADNDYQGVSYGTSNQQGLNHYQAGSETNYNGYETEAYPSYQASSGTHPLYGNGNTYSNQMYGGGDPTTTTNWQGYGSTSQQQNISPASTYGYLGQNTQTSGPTSYEYYKPTTSMNVGYNSADYQAGGYSQGQSSSGTDYNNLYDMSSRYQYSITPKDYSRNVGYGSSSASAGAKVTPTLTNNVVVVDDGYKKKAA
ncbi:unnamed protein product [Nippostrongylus brasiliensis]|uniref:RNA-binding protein FUS n=1 Tax=Nippostrongylus brasiliensis TaxID=27835 RepID=A0A0N4YDC7_NIPBR|nr:unnamed protein product [Nippostrongylus brasiliensis]